MDLFVFVGVIFAALIIHRGRKDRFRALVLEHLAILTRRELPIGPGLNALAKERGESWGRRARRESLAIRGLAERFDATASVADALATQPRTFPPQLVALVRAAESKGALPEALSVLRTEERDRTSFGLRLAERAFYPIALVLAVVFLAVFLEEFIEPKLANLGDSLGIAVPDFDLASAATSALVAITATSLVVLVIYIAGGRVGRLLGALGAWIGCSLPLLAHPVRRLLHARWLARAGSLLAAGATLPETLDDVARATRGPHARALARAAKAAREGHALEKVLGLALGKDAPELTAPLILETRTHGIAVAFGNVSQRIAERSRRRLDALGLIARPIPVVLVAAVVTAHALAVWGSFIAVQNYVIGSFHP